MAAAFKACSVDSCNGNAHYSAKGALSLCNAHYKRFTKYGDPLAGHAKNGEPKLWLDAALTLETDECIEWPFGRASSGYGMIKIDHRMVTVHSIACTARHGEKPSSELEAAHSCGNRGCCNPSHLRWATSKENSADKALHGTKLFGETSPTAKLKEAEVIEVIALLKSGARQASIAREFNVSTTTIYQIANGKTWTHLRG